MKGSNLIGAWLTPSFCSLLFYVGLERKRGVYMCVCEWCFEYSVSFLSYYSLFFSFLFLLGNHERNNGNSSAVEGDC